MSPKFGHKPRRDAIDVTVQEFIVTLIGASTMYESSCSYQSALDLKRVTSCTNIKSEECMTGSGDWAGCAYRFACNSSTFEQLKQSVEKAKAALQDRGGYSAFSDLATSPFCPPPTLPDRRDDGDKRPHIPADDWHGLNVSSSPLSELRVVPLETPFWLMLIFISHIQLLIDATALPSRSPFYCRSTYFTFQYANGKICRGYKRDQA
ncbi:Friend leukemia integration 1 transcription factor [Homalodisca vitripennis]|nr:Friend leukemia integration 1 transcription factor [Homalodisca vitripennis]